MEVKEAIKFLRNHFKIGIYEKKSLDIISLLKRLEKYEKRGVISGLLIDEDKKYKQIFEEMTTNGYFSSIDTKYLRELERKYFPKEVKTSVQPGF